MSSDRRTGPTRVEVALRTAQRVQRSLPRPSAALRAAEFPLRAPTVPGGVEPLPEEPTLGAAYETSWARSPVARSPVPALTVLDRGPILHRQPIGC